MIKILKAFLFDKCASTLAMTYSFSPNTLAQSAQVNQNFQDVVAVVNALTSVNYSDDSVTAAKLNGDVVRATYGLIQHTDGSLYVDVSDTNPSLELTDGGLRVKCASDTIGRTSDGLKIVVPSEAQGDILYRNASGWVRLPAGTSGQALKTLGAGANPAWADFTGAGLLGSAKNLLVVRDSATQVTVTADEMVLEDSSNNKVIIRTVSEAIAITTAGASGLDTGAEAANTIYYIWIIRKSSDGTVNGLLSASASSPTMPSGYDQKALVSCVGNNNSSDFIAFRQTGKKYWFTTWATMASGSTSNVLTEIDMTPANMSTNAGFVPSALSDFCWGTIGNDSDVVNITNISGATLPSSVPLANFISPNSENPSYTMNFWQFNIITADRLYWSSGGTAPAVFLAGFELNKI